MPFAKAIDWAAQKMTILLTAVMISVVGVNVFSRYLLGFSFGWGEELPRYCLVWIAFAGGTVAVKQGQMMAISFLIERLPPAVQGPMRIVGLLSSGLFLAVAAWFGVKLTLATYLQASPALRIPMSFVYVIIPVSCLVMLYHLIGQLIGQVRAGSSPDGGSVP